MGLTKHKHHITPRHQGGSDAPENLVELSVTQHAMWHYAEWKRCGRWQDRLAWKALSGQISMEEAAIMAQKEGQKKGVVAGAEAWRGQKHSEETKVKIREKARGRKHTEETKRKVSEGRKGKGVGVVFSEERRKKIGDALRGKTKPPESEETRRRKSEAQKKRWATIGRRKSG